MRISILFQERKENFACDCVLIAVGLNPVDEFLFKAQEVGLQVYAAGDAAEIAEASAAIFSGKIKGLEIAKFLGEDMAEVPQSWSEFEEILKSKPGKLLEEALPESAGDVFPVMHCRQEIPCDPCASVCPNGLISVDSKDIRHLPVFCEFDEKNCIACERCVAVCPGLAITLVDFRKNQEQPTVSIPLEFSEEFIQIGDVVTVTDVDGHILGNFPVTRVRTLRQFTSTLVVRVQVPAAIATQVAGIRMTGVWDQDEETSDHYLLETPQENIICRCEHVTADEIRSLIRSGVRDINQIKAATRATMGACGGKTCLSLIKKIFVEEGIPIFEVTDPPTRPVFVETPLSTLSKNRQDED